MQRYTPPKPVSKPADYEEFYESLTPAEKELDALAIDMLQSSYFIQWTHMYTKWIRVKSEKVRSEKKE
jgi:hypothetical protein